MTLAQTAELAASVSIIRDLGAMGMALYLLWWIVTKGIPAQTSQWLVYLRERDTTHRADRESDRLDRNRHQDEDRKSRHDTVDKFSTIAGPIMLIKDYIERNP